MTELIEQDTKIVITASHMFKKWEEILNLLSRDMKDINTT